MSIAPILEVGKYNGPSKSICMFKARGLKSTMEYKWRFIMYEEYSACIFKPLKVANGQRTKWSYSLCNNSVAVL
jgi:hypothetical protein